MIPAAEFKGQRPHVLILNDVVTRIVEECRGPVVAAAAMALSSVSAIGNALRLRTAKVE